MQRLRNSISSAISETPSEGRLENSTCGCGMDYVRNLIKLPLSFWITTVSIVFFYNALYPFVADASKFIMDVYGLVFFLYSVCVKSSVLDIANLK